MYTAVTLRQHLHGSLSLRWGEHQPHIPEELFPHLFRRLGAVDMSDRELRQDLVEATPVLERDSDARRQALLLPIQVVPRHLLVFAYVDLLPQG